MLDPDASQGASATWQCSPASAGTLSNEGRLAWAHGVGLGILFNFSQIVRSAWACAIRPCLHSPGMLPRT